MAAEMAQLEEEAHERECTLKEVRVWVVEEERVAGPSQDQGKGRALTSEEVRGEVTGVVCDLCERKGIPCQWGKVSTRLLFFLLPFLLI